MSLHSYFRSIERIDNANPDKSTDIPRDEFLDEAASLHTVVARLFLTRRSRFELQGDNCGGHQEDSVQMADHQAVNFDVR